MSTQPVTMDGFLQAVPVHGARGAAAFDLVSSPTGDLADDVVIPCTTMTPRIVTALLTEIQPGGHLCVSGTLETGLHGEPAWLTVDTLDVLAPAPVRALREMVADRYGDYIVKRSAVTAWKPSAPSPASDHRTTMWRRGDAVLKQAGPEAQRRPVPPLGCSRGARAFLRSGPTRLSVRAGGMGGVRGGG
ncbi:hypothetical protein CG740_34810 [Streptomyces sp. CB01201]|uniref:hypothetical protein n=1 Tax=Streptomyces sp. CB01201 TaxID=2020324 RepID=UPI000CAF7A07|nr:hypothetical protein [Streptomyces sp. CB01201]PJM98614.1 hypothetical protein CG740_34810 [Streptomyces sp. CB01201]